MAIKSEKTVEAAETVEAIQSVTVLVARGRSIKHDDITYSGGDEITLPFEDGQRLFNMGFVVEPNQPQTRPMVSAQAE